MENPYQSYATGTQSASDFGAAGSFGYTQDPQAAMRIIERGRRTADSGVQDVERLGTSQQQGGTSGLVDKDRRNLQAEEQYVLGLKNPDDYKAGLEGGKGYITEMIKNERDALRQKYRGQENRAEYQKEVEALKNKAKEYFATAKGGSFATPEMQERFTASHDTIYNKQQPIQTQRTGGRTGRAMESSVTSDDTGFLDEFLSR